MAEKGTTEPLTGFYISREQESVCCKAACNLAINHRLRIPDINKEQLVLNWTATSNLPIREYFKLPGETNIIGEVNGKLIYFKSALGVYFTSFEDSTTDLWLTYPAYPPGW
jgi:hypothetical protein